MIVFTSDHGEMLGSHGLFQKMCMYEEAVRVPLSMKFPHGSYKGTKISQTVSHVDFMPTLCEFLDIHPSNSMDGTSLMPLISGTCKESEDGTAFIQYDGNGSIVKFPTVYCKGKL